MLPRLWWHAAAIALDHPVWAAQRDHLTNGRRLFAGEQAGEHAAQALPDERHGRAMLTVQGRDAVPDSLHGVCCRTDVATEAPGVDPVALAAQRPTKRRRGAVVGAEPGQDQHRVLVAGTRQP